MIEFALHGHVATLTLSRPPANAFTAEGLQQLRELVARIDANPEVRAVVVTGAGEKFFSAGADLNGFADGDRAHARAMAQQFGSAFEALQQARPVVIAAINGYAMGGGLECALACDIRIAEEQAQMALPEAAVGLLPCGCGTQTLPWLVGEGWAKRMILTNERVDAATALRIGLVEDVVPRGQALATALAMAERAGKVSPRAAAHSKRLVHLARQGVPRQAALALERERFVDLFDDADQREGVHAFLEKRAPQWRNA
ncbi:enoyl-CoA hydratase [Cupriavidus taiwanensis]|uniref:enoyl-CoA hydratase n=1 Tax=Cupriavidus taiwanensis TaxID=164546 RepID=UPI000E108436|nr:enoyl-CoA hydratase [Cupriavidus taiwanensis]SOY61291.1 putative ENOYL-COA HYDRATASE ISOMERASE; similar to paaF (E.coli) [Cupriavidus taiwanensis]SOY61512.1 putative ENOYL-COA HYDRATASE ISOMERASE; similar to paaF (E.coli) [Cupriavidus taiwanensis]SOY98006.1 putative ENOYL-COA HYDRATASE ISOMERASE; similar to paaF (E.coli) [Cupriavidus taiwanensis]SOZ68327.1 putative ENOYL-COA HYDRATASE ISOMERASE; similar to paaF (E.coli) [Cupriavidus taiwanensis]SOZ84926.1 putative ENOYL-COA HYDRATASE ISOMER